MTGGCPTAHARSHTVGTRCGHLMMLPARARLMSGNPTLLGPGVQGLPHGNIGESETDIN